MLAIWNFDVEFLSHDIRVESIIVKVSRGV